MSFAEDIEISQCTFCAKSKDENDLIDMGTNSIILYEEYIEFNELIRNVFDCKVCLFTSSIATNLLFHRSFCFVKLHDDQTTLICEDCKNLLIQFYVFKQNARTSALLLPSDNENVEKVKMFLEEIDEEEVFCMRYNKCLTLVPESKRLFMETFKHWQPQVVLEKLESLPLPHIFLNDENSIRTTLLKVETVDQMEEDCLEENIQEETHDEGTPMDEEWIQMEIGNSEIIETEDGEIESWLCTHCEPNERFLEVKEFRTHLSSHEVFEQVFVDPQASHIEEAEVENRSEDASIHDEFYVESDKAIVASFECTKCDFIASGYDELRVHQKSHIDLKMFQNSKFERLFCADCSHQFVSQAHYQAHVNGHQLYAIVARHSSFPVCEICNMMFCDESFACSHQTKHDMGELIEHPIAAEGLFLRFGHHRPELEPMESLSETALKCAHCLKSFPNEESCRLHQLIFHITTLKCPIESRVFKGNQAFSIHMKNNHPSLFGDDVKFMCSVCKQQFETLYEKLSHMKNCDKKRFQCNHCDKKFSQKCYLMTHLRQVSGQTSIVCEVCQKVCRDKGDYQIHIR